jgi:hypothetical protein
VVIVEPLAYFLARGVRILLQKGIGGHNKTGRAKTALHAAVCNPRLLQRMQVAGLAYPFDRQDFRILGNILDLPGTGADEFTFRTTVQAPQTPMPQPTLTRSGRSGGERPPGCPFQGPPRRSGPRHDVESDAIEFHDLPPQYYCFHMELYDTLNLSYSCSARSRLLAAVLAGVAAGAPVVLGDDVRLL